MCQLFVNFSSKYSVAAAQISAIAPNSEDPAQAARPLPAMMMKTTRDSFSIINPSIVPIPPIMSRRIPITLRTLPQV